MIHRDHQRTNKTHRKYLMRNSVFMWAHPKLTEKFDFRKDILIQHYNILIAAFFGLSLSTGPMVSMFPASGLCWCLWLYLCFSWTAKQKQLSQAAQTPLSHENGKGNALFLHLEEWNNCFSVISACSAAASFDCIRWLQMYSCHCVLNYFYCIIFNTDTFTYINISQVTHGR